MTKFEPRWPRGTRLFEIHGMRKAAATWAAENGATERELEAIFGGSGGRIATLNMPKARTEAGLPRGLSAS